MTSIINLRYHAINLTGAGLSHTRRIRSIVFFVYVYVYVNRFFFRSRMVQGSTGRLELWIIEKAVLKNYEYIT